jgi:integrase
MSLSEDPKTGYWVFRTRVPLPDGTYKRISGSGKWKSKGEARAAEKKAIEAIEKGAAAPEPSVLTFADWFHDRYWNERVLGGAKKKKASTLEAILDIYSKHLHTFFGPLSLGNIDIAKVNTFRANLRAQGLAQKTINNILGVLSTPLRYAAEVGMRGPAPKVGIVKIKRVAGSKSFLEIEDYARLLSVARADSVDALIAVMLAGECGLRRGEIRALRWTDIDMKAGTLHLKQQVREVQPPPIPGAPRTPGRPKGGQRRSTDEFDTLKDGDDRTVRMTEGLIEALRGRLRTGFVLPGKRQHPTDRAFYLSHSQQRCMWNRLEKRFGSMIGEWHILRRTFATHAALFGVNQNTLQDWLGHEDYAETKGYIQTASTLNREIPEVVLAAGEKIRDPERRILAMLGARRWVEASGQKLARKSGTPGKP